MSEAKYTKPTKAQVELAAIAKLREILSDPKKIHQAIKATGQFVGDVPSSKLQGAKEPLDLKGFEAELDRVIIPDDAKEAESYKPPADIECHFEDDQIDAISKKDASGNIIWKVTAYHDRVQKLAKDCGLDNLTLKEQLALYGAFWSSINVTQNFLPDLNEQVKNPEFYHNVKVRAMAALVSALSVDGKSIFKPINNRVYLSDIYKDHLNFIIATKQSFSLSSVSLPEFPKIAKLLWFLALVLFCAEIFLLELIVGETIAGLLASFSGVGESTFFWLTAFLAPIALAVLGYRERELWKDECSNLQAVAKLDAQTAPKGRGNLYSQDDVFAAALGGKDLPYSKHTSSGSLTHSRADGRHHKRGRKVASTKIKLTEEQVKALQVEHDRVHQAGYDMFAGAGSLAGSFFGPESGSIGGGSSPPAAAEFGTDGSAVEALSSSQAPGVVVHGADGPAG